MFRHLLILYLTVPTSLSRNEPYIMSKPLTASDLLIDPNSPAFKSEFTFILEARAAECYYHYVPHHAKLQFQYQVLTAPSVYSNNKISVEVKDNNWRLVHRVHFMDVDDMPELISPQAGFYEFCLLNTMERFGQKKVRVMISYIREREVMELEQQANETNELTSSMKNFVTSMTVHYIHIYRHFRFQILTSGMDLDSALAMRSFVDRISILLCVVVVMTAVFQTWSLKRMFRETTNKPRA